MKTEHQSIDQKINFLVRKKHGNDNMALQKLSTLEIYGTKKQRREKNNKIKKQYDEIKKKIDDYHNLLLSHSHEKIDKLYNHEIRIEKEERGESEPQNININSNSPSSQNDINIIAQKIKAIEEVETNRLIQDIIKEYYIEVFKEKNGKKFSSNEVWNRIFTKRDSISAIESMNSDKIIWRTSKGEEATLRKRSFPTFITKLRKASWNHNWYVTRRKLRN